MCVLLNAFHGSCLTLNDLAICTENTLCVFKILSIHLAIPRHVTDKYVLLVELANSKCTFYFPSAKDLSHYPPCLERRSDLSNITC